MAGDRELACVVFGLIGLGLFWGASTTRHRAGQSVLGALMEQSGSRTIRDVARRIAGDYRLFHDQIERLGAMKGLVIVRGTDLPGRAAYDERLFSSASALNSAGVVALPGASEHPGKKSLAGDSLRSIADRPLLIQSAATQGAIGSDDSVTPPEQD